MIRLATSLLVLAATPSAREEGPRLLIDPGRLAAFREAIGGDGPFRRAWERIHAHAEDLLGARLVPEAKAEKGRGQHGNYGAPSGQMRDMGEALGLAFAVTGDARYAAKLREALLFYSRYERWGGKAFFTWDPPWHSELNTARFLMGYAAGLDLLGAALSPEDRRAIAGGMVRLGLRPTIEDWLGPERRVHTLDSMGHNWWSVCVGAAGTGALAIEGDVPEARTWADQVARAYPAWFAYPGNLLQNKARTFDRTGGFYESAGYADYALRHFYLFREAYRRARGARAAFLDRILAARAIPGFFLHTFYPTRDGGLTVNFGDQDLHGSVSAVTVLSAARDAGGELGAALRWSLARTREVPRSLHEIALFDPAASAAPPATLPLGRWWPDMGWAVLRDRWAPDATLLAAKCGDTWNHAHADAGSFILWTAGRPVLIDSGTCSYGRPEYTGYFCRSRAHNVVLFEGEGQPPEDLYRGSKTRGRIPVVLDGGPGGLRLVLADATGPTAQLHSRNYRTFLWAGRVVLVVDELRSHREGRFAWLLHYEGEARVEEGARRVTIRNGGAGAIVRTIWPEGIAYEEREGLRDHRPDEKVPYLAIVTPEPSRDAKILTAIVPGGEGGPEPPAFERLSGPHFLGVGWREGDLRTEVYLNLRADGSRMHRNSNAVIGPWETDAYLLVIQRRAGMPRDSLDGIVRFLVLCGSYLRCGEAFFLDALAKVHAIVEADARGLQLLVQGRGAPRIRVRATARPERVRVNGRMTTPAGYDPRRRLAEIELPRPAACGGP